MSAARPPGSRARRTPALARIARMPRGEIVFRARQAAATLEERLRLAVGLDPAGSPGVRPAAGPLRFYFDPAERAAIVADLGRNHPAWVARADARAAAVSADDWYRAPRWTADPGGAPEWPGRFHADLDIFGGDRGHGDVRVLWEVNRHRALVDLAKGWFVTGQEAYRRRCRELLDNWRAQNPYGMGINWASALEVAMRALAWTWIYFFLGGEDEPGREHRAALLTGLHEHGVYLERHLSVYFSPNNHLVGEAAALYLLGTFADVLPKAARWERLGWDTLARTAAEQFHADGGSTEQATCYHHFTLGLYLQALAMRRVRGRAVEPELRERLERATWFSLYLARPDGRVPMIGDNDDAMSCAAAEGPGWDFRHVLAAAAVLFERPEFRRGAGSLSELAYWLFGRAGRERFEALAAVPPGAPTAVALRESGYCVMRSGWDEGAHYLCLDCGPLAAGLPRDGTSASAHGHADALALEIAAHGRPIVVDPGCPSYNSDPDWLAYFRGSQAHNTWTVDGRSQSEPAGRLRWSHPAEARLETWIDTGRMLYASGRHDGYERLQGRVRHSRAVLFAPARGWVVRDRLEGTGAHRLETCLPFDPAVAVEAWEGGLLARVGDVGLAIWMVGPAVAAPCLSRGGSRPDQGWIAPSYVRREPTWVARLGVTAVLPVTLWQVHRPWRGEPSVARVRQRSEPGYEALWIEEASAVELLLHSESPGTAFEAGRLESDARALWIRLDRKSGEGEAEILDASFVRWDSRAVWRAGSGREHGRCRLPGLPLEPAEMRG